MNQPRFALPLLLAAFAFVFPSLSPTHADQLDQRAATPQGDSRPLQDPFRPISEIGPDYAVFQWYTGMPCETRLEIRESDQPMTAWRPEGTATDLWAASAKGVRVVEGAGGAKSGYHLLRVDGLQPGKRYYYRLYDPGATPSAVEKQWGAAPPWRREFAVSTQGGKGKKTLIHLPVKVLLMPNVVNIASAKKADGSWVPLPPKVTKAELDRLREEYAITSRFFFINSGMRYWVDFQIFVDDRFQRWGDEPTDAPAEYKNLPLCRSYAGKDFDPPGGGTWTIVDTHDLSHVINDPVAEDKPYPAQVEQAFPRRYNPAKQAWDYYNSGGGTFGPDGFPKGIPGRSQFLGGGDTAWLAAHEFHHQMEGEGAFSLSNREDDRIVFDHPAPRQFPDTAWSTAGRHGEHWEVLAFWDRTLTDAQWLRLYFGDTITTDDKDGDGVPDNDPRLPFDEKRFGSDPKKPMTDGRMGDLAKAMLSEWIPAPLQYTFTKPPFQSITPDPRNIDSDGDGIPDDIDPYPLYPNTPLIWPLTATIDGDASEWANVPQAGTMDKNGVHVTFQQAHDDDAYYGCITLKGTWRSFRLTLDGEGKGIFSSEGVEGLSFTWAEDVPVLKTSFGNAPGLVYKAVKRGDGTTVFEFSLPNRGEGKWFWDRGGREIGAAMEVTDDKGAIYSLYEPYRLFYARMLEATGKWPLPKTGVPVELTKEAATKVLLPGSDPALLLTGEGWTKDGDVLRHHGDNEGVAYLSGLNLKDFDLWIRFEAKHDGILGAFTVGTTDKDMGSGSDYIAFAGGYANTVTRFRLFGREAGDDDTTITPGEHTMQLTRRDGALWCLIDGKPVLFAHDPDPKKMVDRLAVIGGYAGEQVLKEIRVRY